MPATRWASLAGFLIGVLAQCILQVHSAGATFIGSREGWSVVEHTNVTLECRIISFSGGLNSHFSCSSIGFTKNETIINDDPKYIRSGPTFADKRIVCTMQILRVESEDSGVYGCCAIDKSTGLCYRHPTHELNVIPLSTRVETTTKTTPATTSNHFATSVRANERIKTATSVSPAGSTFSKVTVSSNNNSSLKKKDAKLQHTLDPIHTTIWPVLSLAALVIGITVLIGRRYIRKKAEEMSRTENVSEVMEYHSVNSNADVEKG